MPLACFALLLAGWLLTSDFLTRSRMTTNWSGCRRCTYTFLAKKKASVVERFTAQGPAVVKPVHISHTSQRHHVSLLLLAPVSQPITVPRNSGRG